MSELDSYKELVNALKRINRHIEYALCWPEDQWQMTYFDGAHYRRSVILESLKAYRR